MAAGRLSESVAFDEPTGAKDALGGKTKDWTERARCRAEFIYAGGDEAVNAAREAGRFALKVRVRKHSDTKSITPSWRMRDLRTDAVYNLTEVDTVTHPRWVFVVAQGTATR